MQNGPTHRAETTWISWIPLICILWFEILSVFYNLQGCIYRPWALRGSSNPAGVFNTDGNIFWQCLSNSLVVFPVKCCVFSSDFCIKHYLEKNCGLVHEWMPRERDAWGSSSFCPQYWDLAVAWVLRDQ